MVLQGLALRKGVEVTKVRSARASGVGKRQAKLCELQLIVLDSSWE